MLTAHTTDTIARFSDRRYLSAGRGIRIASWRTGSRWMARYEYQIAGCWHGCGPVMDGGTWPAAIEAVRNLR